MTPITWPKDLLEPERARFIMKNGSMAGGRAENASEQIVVSPSPYWGLSIEDIGIYTRPQVLAFRAIIAGLSGMAGVLAMPTWDDPHQPAGGRRRRPWGGGETWGAGELWDMGATDVVVAADAPHRSVTVDMAWTGPAPEAGQYCQIGLGFHIISAAAPLGDGSARMTLWPPLRAPAVAGDHVEMDDPRCLMRLETDEEGALALEAASHGVSPSLRLVESILSGG